MPAPQFSDPFLAGNEIIDAAIDRYYADGIKENLIAVLEAIRTRMHADGHIIFPVIIDEDDENSFTFAAIQTQDGGIWQVAFTSQEEYEKGEPTQVISNFIDATLKS